jgi:hypothetical protein
MKILFLVTGVIVTLTINPLFADVLGNSLNNILKQKDSAGMVNLNSIRVGGKRRSKPQKINKVVRKTRPLTAIIGHYNDGKAVLKKEANAYLKKVTKGKIKDLDLLPRKQRLIVLKDLQKMYIIKHFKSRPSTAVVAKVNGIAILKKKADSYLKSVTRGKVKDFDRLPNKQRLLVIQDLAKPIVLKEAIESSITAEEKEEIFKQMWVEKRRKTLTVSSEEMLALYELKKQKALEANPNAVIPNYMSLGASLKNEILEQKIMGDLMKDVNITVNYDMNKTVVTHELNRSSVISDKIMKTKEQ